MIVDNPDALKAWLTSILDPLCDADPAALAKYVYALVKKEKPGRDLKKVLLDQLDVFLQLDTKPFVELLFQAFESKEYLKWAPKEEPEEPKEPEAPKQPAAEMHAEDSDSEHVVSFGNESDTSLIDNDETRALDAALEKAQEAEKTEAVTIEQTSTDAQPSTSSGSATVPVRAANEKTLIKFMPKELMETEAKINIEWERQAREREAMRRRRSRSWERRQARYRDLPKAYQPHHTRRRMSNRHPSPVSAGRARYRNRSPPASPSPTRSSSSSLDSPKILSPRRYSRSRSPPLRVRLEQREAEFRRISRDREQRERHSQARENIRRERSRDRSPSVSSNNGVSSVALRALASITGENNARRCRDFDVRGYCLRGDMCTYDHGVDPVILEDSPVNPIIQPAVQEYNPLLPEIWGGDYPPPMPPMPPPQRSSVPMVLPIPQFAHSVEGCMSKSLAARLSNQLLPPPPPPPPASPPMQQATHNGNKYEYNKNGRNSKNCTLEVKKIPRGLNEISHLNNHFSKFGKVLNIQVTYNDNPEAALVTFSKPFEANIAYKSTEAVLGNRFIRVYWHNPEKANGQVNATNQLKQEKLQHPASQNKVYINKENLKLSTEIKETADTTIAETMDKDKEDEDKEEAVPKFHGKKPLTPYQEHKRAQDLLDSQIALQKHMIKRLETEKLDPKTRKELMQAVTESQESIESLTSQVAASSEAIQEQIQDENMSRSFDRLQVTQPQKPRSYEEAQKELLDIELDLITKQKEGADVTELESKYQNLRRQFGNTTYNKQARRPTPYYNQYQYNYSNYSYRGRYNPMRYVRPTNNSGHVYVNQSVDHRPRALIISGFEADELDFVTAHFRKYGKFVGKDVDITIPELTIEYRVRAHAEYALQHGKNYNDRLLSITWSHKKVTPHVETNDQAGSDFYIIRRNSEEELDTRHLFTSRRTNNDNSFVINTRETNGAENNGNKSTQLKTTAAIQSDANKSSDTKKPAAVGQEVLSDDNTEKNKETDDSVFCYKGKPVAKYLEEYNEAKAMEEIRNSSSEVELSREEEQELLEELFRQKH